MFLSRRESPRQVGGQALVGPVTVPGDPAGAYLEGERRGLAVYAPGGYHWIPGLGDEVLALKAGEAGESPCVLGVASQAAGLRPGEVLIQAGECSILLSPENGVEIRGRLTVNGSMLGPLPEAEKEEESC